MRNRSYLLAGVIPALMMTAPANSQNYDIHRFCMATAEYECLDWQAMGYSDFASCGNARYDQCVQDAGWPGGGGPVFGPGYDPICIVPGKIGAGEYC